jgi:hypothetical protein
MSIFFSLSQLYGTDKWYIALLPRSTVPIIVDELHYNYYLIEDEENNNKIDSTSTNKNITSSGGGSNNTTTNRNGNQSPKYTISQKIQDLEDEYDAKTA